MDFNQSNVIIAYSLTVSSTNNKESVDYISPETRLQIESIINCGFSPVLFLLGFVGSVMSLVVLIAQGTRETTNIILIGLSLSDLAFVTMWYLTRLECVVRRFDPLLGVTLDALTSAHLSGLRFICGRISACYTVLIATERYIAVLHPLKVSVIVKRNHVIFTCVFLYGFLFACSSALFFMYGVQPKFSSVYNTVVLSSFSTQFLLDNLGILRVYSSFVLPVLFCVCPVVIVTFCTCSILHTLRASFLERRRMTGGGRDGKGRSEQDKVTKTLLSVCILFIVCCMPDTMYQIIRLSLTNFDLTRYANTVSVCVTFIKFFEAANAAANFYLYIATSRKFAKTFRRVFLCGRRSASEMASESESSQKTFINGVY